jgi:N utilization substance protein A
MGARVRAVVAELRGEKIDIIDYSDDPATFVGNALSPAEVIRVDIVDPATKSARVVVPDYKLSLAIGKEGQNARLAHRLTGWRIDIRPDTAPEERGGTSPEVRGGTSPEAQSATAPESAVPAGATGDPTKGVTR